MSELSTIATNNFNSEIQNIVNTGLRDDGSKHITGNWDVDGQATLFIDRTNKRIGIGTTTPHQAFELATGHILIPAAANIIWNDGSNGAGVALFRDSGYMYLQAYDQVWTQYTIAAPPVDYSSDAEATLNLYRNYTSGEKEFIELYNQRYGGIGRYGIRIQKRNGGVWQPFVIEHSDENGYNAILCIAPDGKVGINTETPGAPLTIQGSNPTMELYGEIPALLITSDQSGAEQWKIASAYNDPLSMSIIDATKGLQRILLDSNGNLGIGEMSPAHKLDIAGGFGFVPGTSVAPARNNEVVIEATDDTTLTFKLQGSDGTVRNATLTLA